MVCQSADFVMRMGTVGVDDYLPLDAEWIADQARGVLEDMPVAACKIGMLGSVENIAVIADARSGKIKKGDLVLFTAFGGGFTWGAALVRW